MLNIVRLKVLRELHQRKTLSSVAAALSYSTSAVSQQVRLLEKEIGVPLVEPVGRRLQLTPEGLILVEHADRILAMLEQAETDVSAAHTRPQGTVRMAGFQSAALTLVPEAIAALRRDHPDLQVDFVQGEPEATLPGLASGEVDIVIAESFPGLALPVVEGIATTRIMDDPLLVAMDAELAATIDAAAPVLAQLGHAPWAAEAEDSAARAWLLNECRRAGFEPRIVCSSEDILVQRRFVEAGLAVAMLPGLSLEDAPANVRLFPLTEDNPHREVILATRQASAHRPAIAATTAALEQAARARRRIPPG